MKRKEDQGSQNWLCIEDSSAKGEGRGLGEEWYESTQKYLIHMSYK